MSEQDAINLLIEKGYMIVLKGKYNLTGEFHRTYIPVSTGLVVSSKSELATIPNSIDTSQPIAVKELLKQFTKDADMPFRIKGSNGMPYTVSAVSADGTKAFTNIIKSGINYEILVYSTKLYYKRDGFRKTLTNYLKDGDWEVEYEEFKSKMNEGQIQKHVTKELTQNSSNVKGI